MTNPGSPGAQRNTSGQLRLTVRWAFALIVGQAVGAAIVLSLLFAVMGVPFRRFWVPFLLLGWCGVPLPAIFLWVRAAESSPGSYALRSAVAAYVWLGLIATALSLGAMRVELVSARDVATTYAPTAALALIAVAAWVYIETRRRRQALAPANRRPT